jgi:DNA ligase D-like protein (predicted ligase)
MYDNRIAPMLAYAAPGPFDSKRHLFEIKWDGTRCLLFLRGGEIRLQNRRLETITHRYPELKSLTRHLTAKNAILDGELVVLSEGRSNFSKLQQREQVAEPTKIGLLSRTMPATYVAFDILYLNDEPVITLPLLARKDMLSAILRETPHLLESRFIQGHGIVFFQEAVTRGMEGVMAKTLTGPYLIGRRSRSWLKIKPRQEKTCTVIGYTQGAGARKGTFGALLLATQEKEGWRYRGKVGSGFSESDLQKMAARLRGLKTERSPLRQLPAVRGVLWVRPELWVRVSYQEETNRGHFRAPVFSGWGGDD